MFLKFLDKIKEAMTTVLPVSLIIIILSFTPLYNLSLIEIIVFIISSIILMIGIALFSLGSEIAMEPMGQAIGSSLFKNKKVLIIVLICFIFGLLLTLSEPDVFELQEMSEGISLHSFTHFMGLYISIGAGIFLVIGIFRIIFKMDLGMILFFSYFVIFSFITILIYNGKEEMLGMIFDTGGVTTGAISVPFLMALGIGASQTIGGKDFKDKSFGLLALCSIGPIIVILVRAFFIQDTEITFNLDKIEYGIEDNGLEVLTKAFKEMGKLSLEIFIGLAALFIIFLFLNNKFIKFPKSKIKVILIGLIITFIGTVLFLTASSIGFHPIGFEIGSQLANYNPIWLVLIGFSLGIFVSLAEPPVHILCHKVSDVTQGGVSKKNLLIAISIGVGISIALCMIRIIFNFSILYFLVPGYFIALGLAIFIPKIHTAIAYDAGGVASGPVTLSLILPLAIGASSILHSSNVLADAFGIVAMVSLVPLITIQLLGLKDILKKKKIMKNRLKNIISADDERIIRF